MLGADKGRVVACSGSHWQSLRGVANGWKQCRTETGLQAGCWWASRRCTVPFLAPKTPRRDYSSALVFTAFETTSKLTWGRGRTPRAPCWPALGRVSTRSPGPDSGETLSGKPRGVTSSLGDVTRSPGSAGVPTEEASPALRGTRMPAGNHQGSRRASLSPVSAPQVARGPG